MGDRKPLGDLSRRELLERLGVVGGGAVVWQAAAGLGMTTRLAAQSPLRVASGIGRGKHVVILGGGVAGLATAYELLSQNSDFRCTVVEANPIVGGRSLTLRHGDVLVEKPVKPYLDNHQSSSAQRCTFEPAAAAGYDRPYLNAGPGRIPSAHLLALDYCKALAVPLEVYIMESRSNRVVANDPARVNRHIANDARGWIAQALYDLAAQVPGLENDGEAQEALRALLVQFGALGNGMPGGGARGVYARDGRYENSSRAGYEKLPGVHEGVPVRPFTLDEVLETGFWNTSFYQPEDFLWQSTLFQPVGGMDRIVQHLASAVGAENIRTGSPVERIAYDDDARQWSIHAGGDEPVVADYCVSNIPLPLLEPLLDPDVPFHPQFRDSLETVFELPTTGIEGFLAPTCKVGWQAPRALWQSPDLDPAANRVVPIFGGISWTTDEMTQLWYPSDRFFDELGVLTGAYNFRQSATLWGDYSPGWRLDRARKQAGRLAGEAFEEGLGHGLSIAWQNMPYQRGGWAQWQNVPASAEHYNILLEGDGGTGFYLCGDQMSQLPGWQEGAIASARHAVSMLAVPGYESPTVESTPDSRIMVEGLIPLEVDG